MTTTNKALTDKNEIGRLMGCKPSSAISRLVALGYTEVCGRCGGGGRYSWNAVDGDKCFGCGGSGKRLAKITTATIAEALARIEAGELNAYFAEHKAKTELKNASKALWADYMKSEIGAAYTAASKANRTTEEIHAFVDSSPVFRAQTFQNKLLDRATQAEFDRKGTHAERIAIIRQVHAMILELNRAWIAFSQAVCS